MGKLKALAQNTGLAGLGFLAGEGLSIGTRKLAERMEVEQTPLKVFGEKAATKLALGVGTGYYGSRGNAASHKAANWVTVGALGSITVDVLDLVLTTWENKQENVTGQSMRTSQTMSHDVKARKKVRGR